MSTVGTESLFSGATELERATQLLLPRNITLTVFSSLLAKVALEPRTVSFPHNSGVQLRWADFANDLSKSQVSVCPGDKIDVFYSINDLGHETNIL